MGPGLLPTFLYYFVATTLIVAIAVSQGTGTSLETGDPYQVGIVFGLLAGAFGAYFNRYVMIAIPLKTKAEKRHLSHTLSAMGYVETNQLEDVTVYERSALGKFFSGKFLVQIEQDTATISGRSSRIKALQKRLQEAQA